VHGSPAGVPSTFWVPQQEYRRQRRKGKNGRHEFRARISAARQGPRVSVFPGRSTTTDNLNFTLELDVQSHGGPSGKKAQTVVVEAKRELP